MAAAPSPWRSTFWDASASTAAASTWKNCADSQISVTPSEAQRSRGATPLNFGPHDASNCQRTVLGNVQCDIRAFFTISSQRATAQECENSYQGIAGASNQRSC